MGLANAPSSRDRSWRIGWTRMTLPCWLSWTDRLGLCRSTASPLARERLRAPSVTVMLASTVRRTRTPTRTPTGVCPGVFAGMRDGLCVALA